MPVQIKHNVILFGESGAGKSSILNMLVGENIAVVGNGMQGCTFANECYEGRLGGTNFRIYDTVGLNEGDQGRVPHWKAIEGLYTLIRDLDGVSLLIYCLKGRAKENTEANWILFNKIICAEKVPIIAVVTGLEDEDNLDDWWARSENRESLSACQVKPLAVACVVSIRGKRNEFEEKYLESQHKLRRLIVKYYRKKPWSVEKDKWFANIYREVYTTRFCFSERVHLEFVSAVRSVVDEFIAETAMKPEDSENLQLSLLHAEKKLRKRKKNFLRSQPSNNPLPPPNPLNIIVFGQTGAGKSSLINMLAGRQVVTESNDARGNTKTAQRVEISRNGRKYTVWDTSGLNEGDQGTRPSREAMDHLRELVKDVGSVNLVIYCIRSGRFAEITRVNYHLFWRIVCKKKVPIVLVVTGLEQENNMDDWWDSNRRRIRHMGMTFDGHACVTTTKGTKDLYLEEYSESAEKVWKLVDDCCRSVPWIPPPGHLEQAGSKIDAYWENFNTQHLKWLPVQITKSFATLFRRRE